MQALVLVMVGVLGAAAGAQQAVEEGPAAPVEAPLASGWTDAAGLAVTRAEADGARVRIVTWAPAIVRRAWWPLAGVHTVRARFEAASASVPGEYGISVREGAVTCAARSDGLVALHEGPLTGALVWTQPFPDLTVTNSAPLHDITVSVGQDGTTCVVDGHLVGRVRAGSERIAGRPGVYVGPPGEVLISGFRIEADGLRPSGAGAVR